MNDVESNSTENPGNSAQNQSKIKQKQRAPTPIPTVLSSMIRIFTININGHFKAKWTYMCNVTCFENPDIIIMTEHQVNFFDYRGLRLNAKLTMKAASNTIKLKAMMP